MINRKRICITALFTLHFIVVLGGRAGISLQEQAGEVTFSRQGGMYNRTFQLKLTSDNVEDQIYYTTDGSLPEASGQLYTGAFEVAETVVIRAQVINDTLGPVTTHTYLLNTSHELPVISIVTDPANLWDENEGVYVKGPNAELEYPYFGANFWQDWEKPIHIEMYEPSGALAFSQRAGVKIFGGWSRGHEQKSLAVYARKEYGDGDIDYQLFSGLTIDSFDNFILRNSGNDWNQSMFRDALMTSLFHETVDKQAYRPAVIYLNGHYWGIQNIREKINEDFLSNHHGVNPDSITLLENLGTPIEGNPEVYLELYQFIADRNLAIDENYEYVKSKMDVFNFLQYQVGNIYVDNKDWPGNNLKYWKSNKPGSKWRWIAYDTDFGFHIENVSFNTLAFALEPNGPNYPNPAWSTLILRKLLENESFKNQFVNAFADRLNTVFLPENVVAKIDALEAGIKSEIGSHLERWGGSMAIWEENVSEMRKFAEERPSAVREHLRSVFGLSATHPLTLQVNDEAYGAIQVNTLSPVTYPWKGEYFQDIPVVLKAIPQPGYAFSHWEGDATGTESPLEFNLTKASVVQAVFESTNSELNSIVINEINYNPAKDFDTEDWVELYNKGLEVIDMSGWVLKDDDETHSFLFPEGTILEAGDFLVVCRNNEAFSTLVEDVPHTGNLDFGLSSSMDCVRLYNAEAVLTDEVCFGSSAPWPLSPNGKGATLALKSPFLNNAYSENWYALGDHGNPGESNEVGPDFLAIDENPRFDLKIHPNPVTSHFATVTYVLKDADRISLNVYDVEGRLVRALHESAIPESGKRYIRVATDFPSGIYLIKLEGIKGTSIIRFIVD